MAKVLRLDRGGILAMLKSPAVAAEILNLAADVASEVEAVPHSGEVLVDYDTYTTDRAAAGVTLVHPGAVAMEAKHGYLAKAAASAGLQVRSKGGK